MRIYIVFNGDLKCLSNHRCRITSYPGLIFSPCIKWVFTETNCSPEEVTIATVCFLEHVLFLYRNFFTNIDLPECHCIICALNVAQNCSVVTNGHP